MASREYRKLAKNIALLRSSFLVFEKSPDGKYSRHQLVLCRAFVAFSHAEFEHYFEAIATKLLTRAKKRWDEKRTSGVVLTGLMAFRTAVGSGVPADLSNPGAKQTLEFCIGNCCATHQNVINANNGIKPENIAKLFAPLGVGSNEMSEPLSIQLRNFGRRRGGLVHDENNRALRTIRDPFDDEEADIQFLLTELEQFDIDVGKLR